MKFDIESITAIVGILISIVAVFISVRSLKITQRSIEEANRPYVVVYKDYIQVLSDVMGFIVIKNFGRTGAIIDSIEFSPDYRTHKNTKVFENINNTFIAPGQTINTVVTLNAFREDRNGVTKVKIRYHFDKKYYEEDIMINEEISRDLFFAKTKPSKNTPVGEIIAKTTSELLRRGL